jgi:hypothetical protein
MEPNIIISATILAFLLFLGGFFVYSQVYKTPAEPSFESTRTSAALSDRIDALESLVRQGMAQAHSADSASAEAKSTAINVRDQLNGKISGISRKQSELESQFSGLAYHILNNPSQTAPNATPTPGSEPNQMNMFDSSKMVR